MKDRIKALRAKLGLSQAALGALIGVSVTSVNRWENGVASPKNGTILKVIARLERKNQ